MRKIFVAPSLLAADFKNLSVSIERMYISGATHLHFDVMDGHFVPNISFGSAILKDISELFPLINDVHLMISDPEKYFMDFVNAGADIITFHYESVESNKLESLIHKIKDAGVKCGISIKPNTDVSVLFPLLNQIDLVLIMSVEPGFGGQKFMPMALDKIKILRKEIDKNGYGVLIEVDGGVNETNIELLKQAGVDILVAGTYLFNADDPKSRIEAMTK